MQQETDTWNRDDSEETGTEHLTCKECKNDFRTPLLATISSDDQATQEYYACPRCLTRVADRKPIPEKEEKPIATEQPKKPTPAPTEPSSDFKCEHTFGYLKTRQKDAPIPEQCLVCSKMVECLLR